MGVKVKDKVEGGKKKKEKCEYRFQVFLPKWYLSLSYRLSLNPGAIVQCGSFSHSWLPPPGTGSAS